MIVVLPPLFVSARLFPATSPDTFATCFACSRHTLAGAASNPDGPGVSRSFFRKESDSDEIIRWCVNSWLDEGKASRGTLEYSTPSATSAAHANDSCIPQGLRRSHIQ